MTPQASHFCCCLCFNALSLDYVTVFISVFIILAPRGYLEEWKAGNGHCLCEQPAFACAWSHITEKWPLSPSSANSKIFQMEIYRALCLFRIYCNAYQNPVQCCKYLGASSNDTNQGTTSPSLSGSWQASALSATMLLSSKIALQAVFIIIFYCYFASFHTLTDHKFLLHQFLLCICSVLILRL